MSPLLGKRSTTPEISPELINLARRIESVLTKAAHGRSVHSFDHPEPANLPPDQFRKET